jgi:hypothetical protein
MTEDFWHPTHSYVAERKSLDWSNLWSFFLRHQPHHLLSGAEDSASAPVALLLMASKASFACMATKLQEFKQNLHAPCERGNHLLK